MKNSDEIIKMIDGTKRIAAPVTRKSNLYTDLGINSLSFIALLLKIEEAYSITFDISEMAACIQVDRLIALVEEKRKGAETL